MRPIHPCLPLSAAVCSGVCAELWPPEQTLGLHSRCVLHVGGRSTLKILLLGAPQAMRAAVPLIGSSSCRAAAVKGLAADMCRSPGLCGARFF